MSLLFAISQLSKGTGTFIPPTFKPSDVSNLYAWYDITDTSKTTIVSGHLQGISDKGPNSLHMVSTSGTYPTYFSSGGSNGLPYAKLQSTNHLYVNLPGTQGSNLVYYIVYKYNSADDNSVFLGMSNTVTGFVPVTANGFKLMATAGNPGGYAEGFPNTMTGNWQTLKRNFSTTEFDYFLVNNDPDDPIKYSWAAGQQDASVFTRFSLGASAPYNINMDISEMIIIQGVPSVSDDFKIKRYLMAKYNPTPNNSILFFGDSITWGANSSNPYSTSYPAISCAAKGLGQINIAYPGAKVADSNPLYTAAAGTTGIELVDKILQLQNAQYDYSMIKYIVVAFGTNDVSAATSGLSAWKARYKQAIQDIHTLTSVPYNKIILGTAPYQSNRISSTSILASTTSDICTELGCVYCDFITPTQAGGGDSLLNDGTHPVDAGHLIMANTLTPLLT